MEKSIKNCIVRTVLISCLFLLPSSIISKTAEAAEGDFFFEPKTRIEVAATYDSLSPRDNYGTWKDISMSMYRTDSPTLTWFAQASSFSRREGSGQLGAVGAYKDWNKTFYTFTSVSAGTSTDYLPKVRFDQDFNVKFGSKKNYVWTVGGSRIQYHGDYRDTILSTGITAYKGKTVAGYRIFRNESDPGSVTSYSHEISLAYGKEKFKWTTLTYSFGKQAYLASYFADPEEVRTNSKLVTLNHRHWLSADHGFFAEISYFDLQDSYDKKGLSIGYFREY